MKKYKLIPKINDESGNVIPLIVNGINLEGQDVLLDKTRDQLVPFEEDQIFKPLLLELYGEEPKDKITDIIADFIPWNKYFPLSYSPTLISTDLKEEISQFNIQKFNFHSTELHAELKIFNNYLFMHVVETPLLDFIDFEHTLFESTVFKKRFQEAPPSETFTVSSKDELPIKVQENGWLWYKIKELAAKDLFWENDMMFIENEGYIISENLKAALENGLYTGMTFEEFSFPFKDLIS